MKCSFCGSENIERVEVDIGVGIQYGPATCADCGAGEDSDGIWRTPEDQGDEVIQ